MPYMTNHKKRILDFLSRHHERHFTIEEIIEESGTSRGSFYHYFEGKDALLSSLSFLFDEGGWFQQHEVMHLQTTSRSLAMESLSHHVQ